MPSPRRRQDAASDAPTADDDACLWPVRHVIVPAAGSAPPRTKGLSSVFALGQLAALQAADTSTPSQAEPRPQAAPSLPLIRVDREAGRVRVVRLRLVETEAWAESERQRRAKQRPPKPTRRAKSKSAKLRKFIQFSGDDWDA